MKTAFFLLVACAVFAPSVQAANPAAPSAATVRAEVVYVAPENFTDVRDSYTGSDAGRDAILDELREYFVDQARRHVPADAKLYVSVSDVDLAGEYEPWRGPNWDDVRVVKDIYPPRISLTYRVASADGQILKEGKSDLRDLSFLMKITGTFRDDPLRHEKTLINDWFRETFRGAGRK